MPTIHEGSAGRLYELADDGTATRLGCSWLVMAPTNNPEPDQMYGLGGAYAEVECGSPVTLIDEFGSFRCDNGHEHISYSSPHRAAAERDAWMVERMEAAGAR